MTATGHALVGAAIVTKIPDLRISLPLVLISHFVLDKLPHWDPMTNRKAKSVNLVLTETVIDVVLGLALVGLIFVFFLRKNPVTMFAGALVSYSPDMFEAPYVLFKLNFAPSYYLYRFQKWIHDLGFNARAQAPWGVITQVLVVAVFLLWALR